MIEHRLYLFSFLSQLPTCIFDVHQVGDEFTVVGVLKMTILEIKATITKRNVRKV